MEFSVSSVNLLNHLQTISRAISSKNTNPILDNFLFKVDNGKLTLIASDTETMMQTEMDLNSSEGSCSVALSSKILLEALKEFSDQPLTFQVNNETFAVQIVSDSGVYKFVGTDGKEYPTMQSIEGNTNKAKELFILFGEENTTKVYTKVIDNKILIITESTGEQGLEDTRYK